MGLITLSFSCFIVLLGILISLLGTSVITSTLMIWPFLVLGTLSSCCWLKSKVVSDALALYFVVSVLGSLIFLIGCIDAIFSSLVLQLSLLLKTGLAPFQFWVYKVLGSLDVGTLCFFLGPLKFGLLWLIVNISSPSLVLFSASLYIGLSLLWLSRSLHVVLYASGSCQLLILIFLGSTFFTPYFFIYLLALLGIFWFKLGKISALFAFLGLGALPPLTMFWAKFMAVLVLPSISGFLVLFISLLRLWPYLRCSLDQSSSSSSSILHATTLIALPSFVVLTLP